ncbi:MAG: MFS transporter [Actinomycetota bacterium]
MPISRVVPISLFVQAASVGMVFALLHEVQEENGLSTASIGLISGVGLFAAVLGQVGLAPLADRGRGRELMVAAMVVGSFGALGFAFGSSLWQLVLARAVSGIALGAFDPAAQALVSTRDPDRAGELLGRLIGVRTAGFLIGPGLGAIVANAGDNDSPFIVTGLLLLVLAPFLARIAPTDAMPTPDSGPTSRLGLLRRRPVLAATVLTAALVMPVGLYDAIWAILMDDRGASTLFTGLTLSLYGIPFIALAPVGGRIADRYGTLRVMPFALTGIVGVTIVYGLVERPGLLVSLALFEATFNAFGLPASQAAMAKATAEHERALGFGVAAAAGQIAAGIAALISAPLYDGQGQFFVFAVLAAGVAVVGAIGLALARPAIPVATPAYPADAD